MSQSRYDASGGIRSDIETKMHLSPNGDFTGTLNGQPMEFSDVGLSTVVSSHDIQLNETVSLHNFPIIIPESDDTNRLQRAIIHAFANKKNLLASNETLNIGSTIIIPQQPNFDRSITLDFGNSTFIMLADVPLFVSGYDNGGTLSSNFGSANEAYNSFGVRIGNFSIDSIIGLLSATTLKIQDYHQGCELFNIASNMTQTILESCNNFYCEFADIRTILSGIGTQARFIFTQPHNLCKFSGLVGANSPIGYHFSTASGLTACQFTNISFEGMGIGVQFDSYVYDCVIENSYCENITDVIVKCGSYVENLTIRNNYINFVNQANMYVVEYLPLPKNNIIIETDNMFASMSDDSKIFKTKDHTSSYNQFTFKRPPRFTSSLNDLLSDNTNFSSQAVIEQVFNMTSGKAKLVNKYAVGIYSGRYTSGFGVLSGATWVNNANDILTMDTRLVFSDTQKIYVNVRASATGFNYIKGEFIGNVFYEYTPTGILVTNKLAISVVDGYQRIISTALPSAITNVVGEVRLI